MKKERGSLLLAVLPLALVAGGLVLLSATSARAYIKEHGARRVQIAAVNDANAAMAVAQARIRASNYTANKNDVLHAGIDTGAETGQVNAEGNSVRVMVVGERSEVWVSELTQGWFQLDAVARVNGKSAHVRTLLRERDPFSRFSAFVNSHPLGIGGEPKGDIHTNKKLQLFFADGFYEDPVTATQGFQFIVGATEENTRFAGGSDRDADVVAMPGAAQISALSTHSDGALAALLGGADADAYNINIQLNGDSYDLVAVPKAAGEPTLSALGLAFPASGVIFVNGDIASLKGTLDARITVGCTGQCTIAGNIQYVDSAGETIMQNGLSEDPDNEPYTPNPDYDGNAALGVIALESILYSHDVPDHLEVNGVFFSATGAYGLPGLTLNSSGLWVKSYDSSFRKESYRRLGGIITDKRIVSTVVNRSGTVLSGFNHGHSVFDKRLRSYPPPHFLTIDRPLFLGYRILSGTEAGTQSTKESGWNLGDVVIGSIAKAGVLP